MKLLLVFLVCGQLSYGQHEGHNHYWVDDDGDNSFLHDKKIITDWEHLKEDALEKFQFELDDKMSDEEKEFYYFQLHDLDGDGMLDGLEILAAINHVTEEEKTPIESQDAEDTMELVHRLRKQKKWNTKFLKDSKKIDDILRADDANEDGFLSYTEFSFGRRSGSLVQ